LDGEYSGEAILIKVKRLAQQVLSLFQDVFTVQGWLYWEEAQLLHNLGKAAKLGIVEIGSWKGLSTIQLAQEATVPVYAVDPHRDSFSHRRDKVEDTYNKFMLNLKKFGVSEKVIPIRMKSEEARAVIHPLYDVLWIDGDHSYAGTREHFDSWAPDLTRGGVLAMHDIVNQDYPDPLQVWREIISTGEWLSLGFVRSTGVAVKR